MVRCTTLCMHMRLSGVESDGHMYYSLRLSGAESDGHMYYSLYAHEVEWSGI